MSRCWGTLEASGTKRSALSAGGRRRLAGRWGSCAVVLLAAMPLVVPALPVHAATDPTRLGINAVNQKAIFFDLTMAPGEKRKLSADLVNGGTEPIAAVTYAADVYTIVNGGFGVMLRGEQATGTTTWLDYPTGSLQLQPAKPIRRDFTVSVPTDATPGDYITSLVLENQDPIQGSGGVTFNQVVRHALAVAITIPGPRSPALHVSSALHSVVAGRSVVAIAVENPGNMRLKPAGDSRLFDASGHEVAHTVVTMDSFYARTSTHVETTLVGQLPPGHYTAVLALTDKATGLSVTSDPLPFEVAGPPAGASGPASATQVQQAVRDGVPVWLLVTAVAMSALAGVLAAMVIPFLRRRRNERAMAGRGGL